MLEYRVLRRTFGSKSDEMIRGSRKLHTEKLHNLYFSPNIIRMIKSRTGLQGTHGGEERIAFQWESQKEIDNLEDKDVGRRMILRWILDRMG
jgi:hypothetical protein